MSGSFTIDEGMKITIAGVCYGAFRNWTQLIEGRLLPDWAECDPTSRNEYIRGVFYLISNFENDTPKTPRELHGHWYQYRASLGWGYGETRDLANRLHPLMLPWISLNARQRLASELFVSIVETFLKAANG